MQHAAKRVSCICEYGFAETQTGNAHGPLLFAAAMNFSVLFSLCKTRRPEFSASGFPAYSLFL